MEENRFEPYPEAIVVNFGWSITGICTDKYAGQFQVTVFSRFCYILLCNHECIHYLNYRQANDYITRRNETERKLSFERRQCTIIKFLVFLLNYILQITYIKDCIKSF